jgi:hypothetical protein
VKPDNGAKKQVLHGMAGIHARVFDEASVGADTIEEIGK